MKYYDISITGETGQIDVYCYAKALPDELGFKHYYLREGLPLAPHYPSDPFKASIHLSPKYMGIKLGSLIGNSGGALLLHKDLIAVIQQHNVIEIEVLPFTLYDHKGRVHSKEYAILNPLSIIDCIHMDLSGAEYDADDEDNPYSFNEIILDKSKLTDAPDLFRIKWASHEYAWSERLITSIQSNKFTNIEVIEYEQG